MTWYYKLHLKYQYWMYIGGALRIVVSLEEKSMLKDGCLLGLAPRPVAVPRPGDPGHSPGLWANFFVISCVTFYEFFI